MFSVDTRYDEIMDSEYIEPENITSSSDCSPCCRHLKIPVTAVKPGTAIVRFWRGIVDVVLRAVVVGLCFSLFVMNSGLSQVAHDNDPLPLPAWGATAAFVVMTFDFVVFVLRFINFLFVYQYPLVIFIIDVAFHVVAVLMVIPALFTFLVVGDVSMHGELAGFVTGYTCLLILVLGGLCVFSILWYCLKWYNHLKTADERTPTKNSNSRT